MFHVFRNRNKLKPKIRLFFIHKRTSLEKGQNLLLIAIRTRLGLKGTYSIYIFWNKIWSCLSQCSHNFSEQYCILMEPDEGLERSVFSDFKDLKDKQLGMVFTLDAWHLYILLSTSSSLALALISSNSSISRTLPSGCDVIRMP